MVAERPAVLAQPVAKPIAGSVVAKGAVRMPRSPEEQAKASDVVSAAAQAVQPAVVPITQLFVPAVEPLGVSGVGSASRPMELVAVVEEICDAIVVSPGLLRGEGEMRIQLKPEVLGGSEIQLSVTGGTLSVVFLPASPEAQRLLEQNIGQLQQRLSGHLHNYQIAVSLKKDKRNERV